MLRWSTASLHPVYLCRDLRQLHALERLSLRMPARDSARDATGLGDDRDRDLKILLSSHEDEGGERHAGGDARGLSELLLRLRLVASAAPRTGRWVKQEAR